MSVSMRRTPLAAALLALFSSPSAVLAQTAAAPADPAPATTPSEPTTAPKAGAAQQLPDVRVTDQADRGYAAGAATIGGKVPTATRDIPQVVNVVNRAVLDSQNATTLTEALRNVPGVTLTAGEGGQIGDNINLRGFTARTDIYLDGMRDRGQYRRDTFATESVEVLKGPSSLFFGRGSTGGVINQVSKTPTNENRTDIGGSVGTDDYYRTTLDTNHTFSDHAAVRLAAMWQDVDSTRDVVNNRDWGLAPSLKVGLDADTDVTVSGTFQHNRDVPDYGIPFAFGKPAKVDHDRFYGDTDDYFDQEANIGRVKVEHRFTPWLRVQNQLQAAQTHLKARPTPYRVCTAAFDVPAGSPPGTSLCPVPAVGADPDDITIQSDRRDREIDDGSIFDQFDLLADFKTGFVDHQVVTGLEVGRDRTENQGYTWSSRVLDNLGTFDPGVTEGLTRTRAATRTKGNAETAALYVNDTLSFGRQWKVVAGVRRDRFDAEAKTIVNATGATALQANGQPNAFDRVDWGTSLRGGVIFQPTDAQSWYVSYGTSFNPSAEAVTISAAQSTIAPEKTRSYEAGTKWEFIEGELSLSTAIFQVEKYNARTTDELGAVSLDGDTRVRGFEVGLVGRILRNWDVMTGYTYLDDELEKTDDGTGVGDARISFQGNHLANTPKNSANLWTTARFLGDRLEAGIGEYFVDKRYVTTANITSVPSWWRTDAVVTWRMPSWSVQLNLQNLFDEDYFDAIVASENGRATPGKGRSGVVTGTYRF